ncbi:MAG TPA: hypothetical protein VMM18_13110 [Gemmatimonadaceae bacterium]|nr:hypothetical protein [Gemmatimonadaceae bacterium]
MATIILIGTDLPLLEGLAQTLGAIGHRPQLALTLSEASEIAATTLPLIAVVQRELAAGNAEALRIPLAPGGTLVLFRSDAGSPAPPLLPALQRAVMADLTLPLERHRLIALVHHVVDRARRTGRGPTQTPADQQAIKPEPLDGR